MRALLVTLLAGLLAGCLPAAPKQSHLPVRQASTPEPSARPPMLLTESAFLQPLDLPANHALGHSYLLLPWHTQDPVSIHRQQAACLALRLALQQAERQKDRLSSQLMPTYWPLQRESNLQDCGRLSKDHDYKRARRLLRRQLNDSPDPRLIARALDGNQQLVVDLTGFSDRDLQAILRFWVLELGRKPEYWQMQGFNLPRIRQALTPFIAKHGKQILQLSPAR